MATSDLILMIVHDALDATNIHPLASLAKAELDRRLPVDHEYDHSELYERIKTLEIKS
ncbi:MAG: hypothetical protein HC882_01885 [Acidobacteria bacterium]|nr:hypothetical protein [Acidobacteriota bacterium]